jgi:hypothetical protein
MPVFRTVLAIALLSALGGASGTATAQAPDANTCLRFAFGVWKPVLDWKAAGHPGSVDSVRVARAEGGQAWAAGIPSTTRTTPGDTLLMLYPAFWPVGVIVSFNPRAFTARDTVAATAVALVGDALKANPVSAVKLWKVPCGR